MPSCDPKIISAAVPLIQRVNPKKIIEFGIGLGKWGLLCREYLDGWQSRPFAKDWKTHLTGVEPFAAYVQDHQRAIYNEIFIAEALPWLDGEIDFGLPSVDNVDLILAMDVLEHMHKETALEVIRLSCQVATSCIFSIPLGEAWLAANSSYLDINSYERHLSSWELDEVESLTGCQKAATQIITGPRGPIGLFLFSGKV